MRRGYTYGKSAYSGDRLERAAELYRSGLSTADIAREFGTHETTVIRAFARAGIPRRSTSEANRILRRAQIARGDKDALTAHQRLLVDHLNQYGPGATSEIARAVGLTPRAAVAALPKLEALGLVRHRAIHARRFEWRRTALSTRDVLDHALAPAPALKPEGEYLPIEPFRQWVRDLIAHEERKAKFLAVGSQLRGNGDGSGGIPTVLAVATRMRTPERVIWRWLNEQRTIALSTADKALQAYAGETTIYDLWPHLAEVDEEVAA